VSCEVRRAGCPDHNNTDYLSCLTYLQLNHSCGDPNCNARDSTMNINISLLYFIIPSHKVMPKCIKLFLCLLQYCETACRVVVKFNAFLTLGTECSVSWKSVSTEWKLRWDSKPYQQRKNSFLCQQQTPCNAAIHGSYFTDWAILTHYLFKKFPVWLG
jgi:hypothetical protein